MDVGRIIEPSQSNQQTGMDSSENINNEIPNQAEVNSNPNLRIDMPIMETGDNRERNEDDIKSEAEEKMRQPFLQIEMGNTTN